MGLRRERRNRKDGGRIHAMATGSGEEDTMVYGEGRDTERKVESEKKGMGIREKIRREKGRGLARDCLEEIRERFREERILTGWKREREKFFEERRVKKEEVEERSRGEENWISKLEEKNKEKQCKER